MRTDLISFNSPGLDPDLGADSRPPVTLLFNADSDGVAVADIPPGTYGVRTQVFSGGLWAAGSARLEITGQVSGQVSYADPVSDNTTQLVVIRELSTVRMRVYGEPWALYSVLAPAARPEWLDPVIYMRAIEDSGVTATAFSDPDARKQQIGPHFYYLDKVAKRYSIQKAFNRLKGRFLSTLYFATAPGDVPPNHGENDRAELKSEYEKATNSYPYSVPFDTPVAWAADVYFPNGPAKEGDFGVYMQWHATEDNPISSGGARLQDNYLSPVWAFEYMAGDRARIVTRGSSDAYQGGGNYAPTVHWEQVGFQRGVWHRFYFETVFSFSGAGQLRVWHSTGEGNTWEKLVDATGLTNAYNDLNGPNFAIGTYSAGEGTVNFQYKAETKRQEVYYDNPDVWVGAFQPARRSSPPALNLIAERLN